MKQTDDEGDECYQTGKKYSLSQDSSPASGALARAAFQRGTYLGHTRCIRELAALFYYGIGGEKDQPEALRLLWIAYRKNDLEALDELADFLDELAEKGTDPEGKTRFSEAADNSRKIANLTTTMHKFFNQLKK